MKVNTYDNENIFDLAIRVYGNINGISETAVFIGAVPNEVDINALEFNEFIEPKQVDLSERRIFQGITNQSIFDIAIQATGSIDGLNDVIGLYSDIDETKFLEVVSLEKKNDAILNEIVRKNLKFATKEVGLDIVSSWILANGIWNDNGLWIDTETWNDN